MPHSFREIDAKQAKKIVEKNATKGKNGVDFYQENKDFIGYRADGEPADVDHWQDGRGFVAPMPKDATIEGTTIRLGWRKAFIIENIVGELVERKCGGVLGRPPDYRYEFKDMEEGEEGAEPSGESEQLAGLNELIRTWFGDKKALKVLKSFEKGLSVGSKAYLRIYIPSERFAVSIENEDGEASKGYSFEVDSLEDAMSHIYVECIERTAANRITDKGTMMDLGVVAYEVSQEEAEIESITTGAKSAGKYMWAELCFVDPDTNRTVIKKVYSDDRMDPLEVDVDLRGNLILYEGNRSLYLHEGMRSNQKDLNTTRSQLRVSNDNAAYNRLILTNALPPVKQGINSKTGEKELAVGGETGPGKVTYLQGRVITDDTGKKLITTPGVHSVDPVKNDGLIKSAEEARAALYRQGRQAHVLISGDATASGESRHQAQGDFILDLIDAADHINLAGRWLLETVLALAHHLAGEEMPEDIKGVFECRLNPGHMSEGMRTHLLKMVERGLISKRTAMTQFGIIDVEAERKQIASEREEETPELVQLQTERARLSLENDQSFTTGDPDIDDARRRIEAAASGA